MIWLAIHGAWSAGWTWKKMYPLLEGDGSKLWAPTMTGLGERAHLANPDITLETHILDILGVIETEGLSGVTLIAHSYGGMVGTAVADRAADRVKQLIYLDAFVPDDGQALIDVPGGPKISPDADWRVSPRPIPPDTSAEDAAWIAPRRGAQPLGTFTTPLRLSRPLSLPRAYIRCTRVAPGDPHVASAAKAREAGWPYREIDASHSPHVTAPELLAATLKELASLA
jgi:pimeloyl-ACP methyl ester carboxylesterase